MTANNATKFMVSVGGIEGVFGCGKEAEYTMLSNPLMQTNLSEFERIGCGTRLVKPNECQKLLDFQW